MGKKAVVLNKFSTKFEYFKYRPEYVECENDGSGIELIEAASARAKAYTSALDEAVALNNAFFLRVKDIVKRVIAEKGNAYQQVYQLSKLNLWNVDSAMSQADARYRSVLEERVCDIHEQILAVNRRVEDIASITFFTKYKRRFRSLVNKLRNRGVSPM